MKRNYLFLLLSFASCLFFNNVKAQETASKWNIDLGPNISLPIRNLSYYTSLGIGLDAAATTTVGNGFSVGGSVNYSYFIGKQPLLSTETHGASVINVLADANYALPQNIFVGVGLGAGFLTSDGQSDTEFARVFNLGYKWDQSKQHTYIFTIYFDQTTYQKCLGVRAAVRL